jgi:hypothetical protein
LQLISALLQVVTVIAGMTIQKKKPSLVRHLPVGWKVSFGQQNQPSWLAVRCCYQQTCCLA